MNLYEPTQLIELFHLEFLRWFGQKAPLSKFAVKGGVNLRLFFNSIRYSEDMDIDIRGIEVFRLKEWVFHIIKNPSFKNNLKTFGVQNVIPPNSEAAKLTETTQRFKIHLFSTAGEDVFTKIEFSKRGFTGIPMIAHVPDKTLRAYQLAPLITAHYDIGGAIVQKIQALCLRKITQARDVFDLYWLSPQISAENLAAIHLSSSVKSKATENIFAVTYPNFKDTVLPYLISPEKKFYNSEKIWDQIILKVSALLEAIH